MAHMIDFNDANLQKTLEALNPIEGFCIMVDIVGSAELKDRNMNEWIIKTGNVFSIARGWVVPKVLKTVGDLVMFWLKDDEFNKFTSPLTLIQALDNLHQETKSRPNLFPPLKVAVCHCSAVLEISFLREAEDVYGKDIDLTARLLAIATEGEVVMNEGFWTLVNAQYKACTGQEEQFPCFKRIQGPWSQKIKGFSKPQPIYKLLSFL